MFVALFVLVGFVIVAVDLVFLPRSSRRAWQIMVLALLVIASMVLVPSAWQSLAESLGVGRAVDMIIYPVTALLTREMFIARGRFRASDRRLTELVRSLALRDARRL